MSHVQGGVWMQWPKPGAIFSVPVVTPILLQRSPAVPEIIRGQAGAQYYKKGSLPE